MEKLNAAFEDAVKKQKVPGVAAIALDRSGNVLFKGAYGVTSLADEAAKPVTPDTEFMIWSLTKIVTSVCALQLVEQGKLSLDDPVEKYLPQVKELQILEGWDDDGKPILRDPKGKPTISHLLTHTSGFTYDIWDPHTFKWIDHKGYVHASYSSGEPHMFMAPFAHEPGEKHLYGINIDWVGMVIEKVTGQPLQEYVKQHITDPLSMKHTGPQLTDESMFGITHHRGEDGSLTANPALKHPSEPKMFGGGHYLYSTLDDFSAFLLALLNEGTHPKTNAQILKPETVKKYVFIDLIPASADRSWVGRLESVLPPLSNDGELLPNVKKGWSGAMMVNLEDVPAGRKAGSGSWAGLANLFCWIDPAAGKLGLIMSAVVPFLDPEVLRLFEELERAVYGAEPANGDHKHFKVGK